MRVLTISDYRDTLAVRPEAEQMIRLAKSGVELEIITYPDTEYENFFREAGIVVHLTHPTKKYDRTFIRYLGDLTHKNKYQIFYLFNSQAIINGLMAAKKLPVKVLLYRGYTGNIHWYDPTAYLKYLHPRVDKIVCLAQSIKEYLGQQPFFNPRKAVTINKGHDPIWYQNIDASDLTELGVPEHRFVIACMGNARPFKGIKYLLKATEHLDSMADLYLLLIGRNMAKGSLGRLIEISPMRDRIITTGWRSDVLSLLAAVDVFILPSIGGEATTKSLIEAMSMGCAPIITNISGNRDLVVSGKNGLVVPPKNPRAIAQAIKTLYDDQHLVEEYGKNAQEHIAENFHIDRTVKETLALFRSII